MFSFVFWWELFPGLVTGLAGVVGLLAVGEVFSNMVVCGLAKIPKIN